VVACAKEKFWELLVQVLGDPRLDSSDFQDFPARNRNRTSLIEILDEVFATEKGDYWVNVLRSAGVPVGPVRTIPEVLEDLETSHSDMLVEVEHETFGRIKEVFTPARVGDCPP
jgi:crotonobetainyl-CoA:carnitine CoA-transferase CaiB-like acyl-CoA transferase